jgi:hypothetical protein
MFLSRTKFFAEHDLQVLEVTGRGENMIFGTRKDICQYPSNSSPSAMSRIFN